MTKASALSIVLIALVAACVSTKVDVPRDHPANPAAPVTPIASPPALATTASTGEDTAPAAHLHGAMTPPAPSAGAAEQSDKAPAEVWTCPMHPEVTKSGPGQCPICGMNLVKRAARKVK